jgi:single-strand DNA-binding protein
MSIEAALFGTLGRDAERKTSKNGKPYLRATIAVSEGEATTWVNATIFDQTAIDNAAKLVKGARVYVEGRISINEWTDRDGKQRHGLSIMSWHCRLAQIGRAKAKSEKPKPAAAGAAFDDPIDDLAFSEVHR